MTKNNTPSKLIFLTWLVYTIAYTGRANYTASLVEIIAAVGLTRAEAGAVSSLFYIFYGAGQIVNGYLSKYCNSKHALSVALFASAIINVLMGSAQSLTAMKVLWSLNGCAQSILWTNIIKLQADNLPDDKIKSAVITMASTVAIGTLAAYGISALGATLHNYRIVFYVPSLLLALAAVLWSVMSNSFENTIATRTKKAKTFDTSTQKHAIYAILALVCAAAVVCNFIKDGATTWVPNILHELYGMPKNFSILLAILLPLSALFGAFLASLVNRKIRNEIFVMTLFFAICGAMLLPLALRPTIGKGATIVVFAVASCLLAGVNNIITSAIPLQLRRLSGAGMTAGVLNLFAYLGSTLSSYTLGHVADTRGWQPVLILLCVTAAIAAVISIPTVILWRANNQEIPQSISDQT